MHGFPPEYAAPPPPPPASQSSHMNGHHASLSHQLSTDFLNQAGPPSQMPPPASNNGPMQISTPRGVPPQGPPGMNSNMRGQMGGFPGARSPPGAKNTSHVPCKFFRQGNCQAGKACPFLHTNEPAGPCKYFQKGNCKYGLACANEHILPDGRRGNRHGYGMPARNIPSNGRGPWQQGPDNAQQGSLLSMQQQQQQQQQERQQYHTQAGLQRLTEQDLYPISTAPPINIPTIDATFSSASHPGSNYGSPPTDSDPRFGKSPVQRGLSVLDAPLPASFDSQGISTLARYGPIAASVPARIPFDSSSPPSSLPRMHGNLESSALRSLHSSAYPDEARSGVPTNGFLGSSPPQREVDDSIGRRIMHSERYSAFSKRGGGGGTIPMSSSVPVSSRPIPGRGLKGDDDWDENFAFEEEFVPKALHDDILTPQEQEKSARRLSSGRLGGDLLDEPSSLNHRRSLQALANNAANSPAGSNSNSLVGSPSGGSRFGALFARQKTDDGLGNGANAFGHVGSPLRNSSLTMSAAAAAAAAAAATATNSTNNAAYAADAPKRPRPTSIGSSLSIEASADAWRGRSPPSSSGIGMLSQQLQRTRLGDAQSTSNGGGGSASSAATRPPLSSTGSGLKVGAERMPSSSTTVGMGRDRIDEEETEQEGLFDMEEVGVGIPVPEMSKPRKGGLKRLSGGAGWGFGLGNRSAPKVGLGEGGINGPSG